MSLNGANWSRNNESAHCDISQKAVLGRPGGWQKLIVENQLLKSNKARKPITKSAISSNISRKRNVLCQSGSELDPFKSLIIKLKEYVK